MDNKIWDGLLPPQQVAILEAGETALQELQQYDDVGRWVKVGAEIAALQTAAMTQAHSNVANGKRYQASWGGLVKHLPHLARLDKSTRSHALWLYSNWASVGPWLTALTESPLPEKQVAGVNKRLALTHPRAIRREWQAQRDPEGAPKKDGATNPAQAARLDLQDKVIALQAEVAALRKQDPGAIVIAGNASVTQAIEAMANQRNADWLRRFRKAIDDLIAETDRVESQEAKAKRKR